MVMAMRFSPSSPTSSIPAVSMMTTGPMGRISMDFFTGSVVVPGTAETIAASWRVSALIRLDFPAFLRPKMAMCNRSPRGVWLSVVIM